MELLSRAEKGRLRVSVWYRNNKKKKATQVMAWRKLNPDKLKEYKERYIKKTGRKIHPNASIHTKTYRSKNPEKVKQFRKNYIEKNRVKINETNRLWRKNNPEKWKIINRSQRHKRRALGAINSTEWIAKVMLFKNQCQKCFKTEPEIKITIDHIIPVSKGGTNHIDNLQPLCMNCNRRKSATLV